MSLTLGKTQTNKVVSVIQKLFPLKYADSAWDNTGLLIDCSSLATTDTTTSPIKVLLTIDLTARVCEEAIANKCNFILSYHPFIFPHWNRIAPSKNPQHLSCLKLIHNGISVYCPHTSVDAAKGGVNDWLSTVLLCSDTEGKSTLHETLNSKAIECVKGEDDTDIGYGRYLDISSSKKTLSAIIENIKKNLKLEHFQIALPDSLREAENSKNTIGETIEISKIALCAGSGSSVFKSLSAKEFEEVDLFLTGEMSHHEVLKFKEMGKIVIVCNHSNTEREYLNQLMIRQLKAQDSSIEYRVSEHDHDPLDTI